MLQRSDPSLTPQASAELSPAVAEHAFRDYLTGLSEWADAARLNHRYPEAIDAAREVLREARLPAPEALIKMTPAQLARETEPGFHSAIALALSVAARYQWSGSRDAVGGEKAWKIQAARKYFECAMELAPENIEHRKGLHALMHDLRQERGQGRGQVSRDTIELLNSLTNYLTRHFKYERNDLEWAKVERPHEDRRTLVWSLNEGAALSRSRGASVAKFDRHGAEVFYQAAIHFALASFAAQGLPTKPSDFPTIEPVLYSRSELRELGRITHILQEAYALIGPPEAAEAARDLEQHLSFSRDHSPDPGRHETTIPRMGTRPTKVGEFPVRNSSATPAAPAEEARLPRPSREPDAPAASAQPRLSKNAWLSPCRVAAQEDPFVIPERVETEAKRAMGNVRKEFKFPREALEKAFAEFAIEIDLIARTQNESAGLFLTHYKTYFDEFKKDPIMLIRIQQAASYLLDCPWLEAGLKGTARSLTQITNVYLQQMELRGDLATVQGVFRPITVAAKFNQLRPKSRK